MNGGIKFCIKINYSTTTTTAIYLGIKAAQSGKE
jgi:hypothetical protein